MSERIHRLAQLLLGKSSLEECKLEEVQHLAKRYPFFAPAQFLLLQKLNETGSPAYEEQQSKAVLYYHDPLQFEYFVSSDKFYMDETMLRKGETDFAVTASGAAADILAPSKNNEADEQGVVQNNTTVQELVANTETNGSTTFAEAAPTTTAQMPSQAKQPELNIPTAFIETDKIADTTFIEPAEPAVLPSHPLLTSFDHTVEENEMAPLVDENVTATETTAVTLPHSPTAMAVAGPEATDAFRKSSENTEAVKQENITNKTTEKVPEPLAFEPFHTVDYFASQGIKIGLDELPKDKLTKQLRSFTEWLKVMKRLPAAELEKALPVTAEKNVESMASHSVEGSEVVTEAMAEVWAKQGAREKAIETYNKLSLLNPSKKAYFAAKIENLRGS